MRAVSAPGPSARSHPAAKAPASLALTRPEGARTGSLPRACPVDHSACCAAAMKGEMGRRAGDRGVVVVAHSSAMGSSSALRSISPDSRSRRHRSTGYALVSGFFAVVVVVFFAVVVVEVAVTVGGLGGGVVVIVLPAFADAQLGPQPVKVSAAAVVLQLAGHLYLLGLGSAAPHWLDPLEHAGTLPGPCSLH